MRLNAFMPIKSGVNSSQNENFVNALKDTSAFTNLADSGIYKWVDNPKLPPSAFAGGALLDKGLLGFVGDLPGLDRQGGLGQIDWRKMATPVLTGTEFTGDRRAGAFATTRDKKNQLIALQHGMPEAKAQDVLAHEFDHLLNDDINKDLISKDKQIYVYDRKNDVAMLGDDYSDTLSNADYKTARDAYERGAHEVSAEASKYNDKNLKKGMFMGKQAALPAEQIITLNSQYMQNPGLIKKAANAISRLKKIGPALSVGGWLADVWQTKQLLDDVNKFGGGSLAPYQRYLGQDVKEDWR